MAEWGKANLSKDAVASYNQTLHSNAPATIKLAIQGLKPAHDATYGQAPKQTLPGSAGTAGPAPFGSISELQAAMSDPRYQGDEAFRQEVYARLRELEIL